MKKQLIENCQQMHKEFVIRRIRENDENRVLVINVDSLGYSYIVQIIDNTHVRVNGITNHIRQIRDFGDIEDFDKIVESWIKVEKYKNIDFYRSSDFQRFTKNETNSYTISFINLRNSSAFEQIAKHKEKYNSYIFKQTGDLHGIDEVCFM